MNRKQYIITMAVYSTLSIAALITNMIWNYTNTLLIITGIFVGYLFIRYKVDGKFQYFSSRFNMLLDYDLDVKQALDMAQTAYDSAPTANLKASYSLYVGMAHYYCGNYEEAIKTFNQIDLARMNPVFHALIFSFTAYSAFEIQDQETFDQCLARMESLVGQVPNKYQSYVASYKEVLEAIKNMEFDHEGYLNMVEKHFAKDDGYLARKLNYEYRKSYYYKMEGNTLEMDKCLAFCIANGKEQHLATRAKAMFQGSVNVEDYVYDPTKVKQVEVEEEVEVIELQELEPVDKEDDTK